MSPPYDTLALLEYIGRHLLADDTRILRTRVDRALHQMGDQRIAQMLAKSRNQATEMLDGVYDLSQDTLALLRTLEEACRGRQAFVAALHHLRLARLELDLALSVEAQALATADQGRQNVKSEHSTDDPIEADAAAGLRA